MVPRNICIMIEVILPHGEGSNLRKLSLLTLVPVISRHEGLSFSRRLDDVIASSEHQRIGAERITK